jgi:hypothetical protein
VPGVLFAKDLDRGLAPQRRRGPLEPLPAELLSTGPTPIERAQDREAADFVQRFLHDVSEIKAAFAMARCQLGLGDARQLASEFSARYPGSVYQQRVHQSCTPDQRNHTEPETHE